MDKTALVMLHTNDHEILLTYRSRESGDHPETWDFSAGGPINHNETELEGAQRELQEKLGIQSDLKELMRETIQYDDGSDEEIILFAGPYDRQELELHQSIQSTRTFPRNEVKRMLNQKEMFHPQCYYFLKKMMG